MKFYAFIAALTFFYLCPAQSFIEAYEATRHLEPYDHLNGTYNDEFATLTGNANEWSKIMGVFYEFDDIRFAKMGIEGSTLLFDEWKNEGVLFVGNKRYKVANINFHIPQEQFMSQIEGDSTFIYDFRGVDGIAVNDRMFKQLFDNQEGRARVFEVVYEDREFAILKAYSLGFVEASPNPMLNRSRNKIKRNHQFFINDKNGLSAVRLKKSTVLGLFSEEDRQQVEAIAKKYNLSFKRENDVQKMLMLVKSQKS
ncbi:MAG: hypothetical protein KJO00_02330 [Bacteroidia bacterium]|nr:hypothetical protein [Bacteroidia bacterium]MBT8286825.1 hypothetical protein [Bacteroidia bacterium]NNK72371.1 hypothetical protein [Flavobacteriaceae bacterium]